MALARCARGCFPLLVAALACDVLGFVLLLVGIFANVRVGGRFCGDFLIYSGSLVVFVSLGFWLLWHAWNVPVRDGDGPKRSDSTVARLARKVTERLGRTLSGAAGRDDPPDAPAREKSEEEGPGGR